MNCKKCGKTFLANRNTRANRGTGGASPPLVMALPLFLFLIIAIASVVSFVLGALAFLWLIPIGVVLVIAFGAFVVSYMDSNIIICPHCFASAGTMWPWKRQS